MKRREFGQYCGLARALELVGERWTLLIVRELLARPSRYTELLDYLPGIPTNVLASRLKELEDAGIVERRIAPAPARGVVYALTADGRSLKAPVIALARWGTGHLGERNGEIVPASTLVLSLRAMFNHDAAAKETASWEIHAPNVVIHAVVTDGRLSAGVGPVPDGADLIIAIPSDEVPSFRDILMTVKGGKAELTGPPELSNTFLRLFAPTPQLVEHPASD